MECWVNFEFSVFRMCIFECIFWWQCLWDPQVLPIITLAWMTDDNLKPILMHFVRYMRQSEQNLELIFFHNHISYAQVSNLWKENSPSIVVLSFSRTVCMEYNPLLHSCRPTVTCISISVPVFEPLKQDWGNLNRIGCNSIYDLPTVVNVAWTNTIWVHDNW